MKSGIGPQVIQNLTSKNKLLFGIVTGFCLILISVGIYFWGNSQNSSNQAGIAIIHSSEDPAYETQSIVNAGDELALSASWANLVIRTFRGDSISLRNFAKLTLANEDTFIQNDGYVLYNLENRPRPLRIRVRDLIVESDDSIFEITDTKINVSSGSVILYDSNNDSKIVPMGESYDLIKSREDKADYNNIFSLTNFTNLTGVVAPENSSSLWELNFPQIAAYLPEDTWFWAGTNHKEEINLALTGIFLQVPTSEPTIYTPANRFQNKNIFLRDAFSTFPPLNVKSILFGNQTRNSFPFIIVQLMDAEEIIDDLIQYSRDVGVLNSSVSISSPVGKSFRIEIDNDRSSRGRRDTTQERFLGVVDDLLFIAPSQQDLTNFFTNQDLAFSQTSLFQESLENFKLNPESQFQLALSLPATLNEQERNNFISNIPSNIVFKGNTQESGLSFQACWDQANMIPFINDPESSDLLKFVQNPSIMATSFRLTYPELFWNYLKEILISSEYHGNESAFDAHIERIKENIEIDLPKDLIPALRGHVAVSLVSLQFDWEWIIVWKPDQLSAIEKLISILDHEFNPRIASMPYYDERNRLRNLNIHRYTDLSWTWFGNYFIMTSSTNGLRKAIDAYFTEENAMITVESFPEINEVKNQFTSFINPAGFDRFLDLWLGPENELNFTQQTYPIKFTVKSNFDPISTDLSFEIPFQGSLLYLTTWTIPNSWLFINNSSSNIGVMKRRTIEVSNALSSYFHRNNSFPESLEILYTEGYLAYVPRDFYALNDSMINYHFDKEKRLLTVWSRGPNLRNDGGVRHIEPHRFGLFGPGDIIHQVSLSPEMAEAAQ